jgi:adenosylcobinamide-GDP ribazoletransferase
MPAPALPRRLADKFLHQLRLFFVALQFFTRLPIPRWVGFAPDWLRHRLRATSPQAAAAC